MNASEILRQAAAKVEQGWTRGHYVDDHGVCAMGALCHVLYGEAGYFYENTGGDPIIDPLFVEVTELLAQEMREQFTEKYSLGGPCAVIYVNDELAHDKSEIIACMEKAAAKLEEQG